MFCVLFFGLYSPVGVTQKGSYSFFFKQGGLSWGFFLLIALGIDWIIVQRAYGLLLVLGKDGLEMIF